MMYQDNVETKIRPVDNGYLFKHGTMPERELYYPDLNALLFAIQGFYMKREEYIKQLEDVPKQPSYIDRGVLKAVMAGMDDSWERRLAEVDEATRKKYLNGSWEVPTDENP
jgi:hypothetical protein